MPLFPLWTALLAVSALPSRAGTPPAAPAPLVGRCVGTAEAESAPSGSAPSDALPQPWNDGFKSEYASLGYKPDPTGRFLVDGDGKPLSKELADWLSAPQDFSKVKVHYLDWSALVSAGYDLDETRCAMKRDDTGDLRRVDYLSLLKELSQGREFSALEQMSARFGAVKGRLPKAAKAELKRFEGIRAGLPADLAEKIRAGKATGGDLMSSYEAQTRMFDASADRAALEKAAAPAPAASVPTPPTKDPTETKLSSGLGTSFRELIGETAYGRDLLEAFRSHGAPMPFMRVQRLAQTEGFLGAFYDMQGHKMVIDHNAVVRYLMAGLPPEEQRRVAEGLKTPEDLRRRLTENPAEQRKFAAAVLGISFHELVHYFQSLTTHFDEEAVRGNTPGAYPIEYEHEAYRETCAFMDQRSLDHPFGEAEWSEVYNERCRLLLGDYERFADGVTRSYAQGYGATTLRDIRFMQELRRRTAEKLLPADETVERLRLSGLLRGDDALHQLELTVGQRTAAFKTKKLPEVRTMVLQKVVPRALEAGRPDVSLALLYAFPITAPGAEDAVRNWVAAAEPAFRSPGEHFPLDFRMGAYQYVAHAFRTQKRHWPSGYVDAYARDLRRFTGNPNVGWGGLGAMEPDQPGIEKVRAAWADGAIPALERPGADFKLDARLGSYQVVAQSLAASRRPWPAPLMAALRRDLVRSAKTPTVGAQVLAYVPEGQPGREAAARAWAEAVKPALRSPTDDFPVEWRVVAWSALGAVPADLKPARDRDGVMYARQLLGQARHASDRDKRRGLLRNARSWASSSAGGAGLVAEIDAEAKR
ncbi:MAG: hypothetical protein HY079_13350 [Elusimicrobia bacterium]|nr:hypothetical protein [Elusimicrobiota bacterium]